MSTSRRTFSIVVSADCDDAIGRCGEIPWDIPEDRAIFRKITSSVSDPQKSNAIICGRKTRNTMPMMMLGRVVIIVSHNKEPPSANIFRSKVTGEETCDVYAGSLQEALEYAWNRPEEIEKVYVIGGGTVYREAFRHPACSSVFCTRVLASFADCDCFFPTTAELLHAGFAPEPKTPDRRSVRGGTGYRLDVFRRETVPKEFP